MRETAARKGCANLQEKKTCRIGRFSFLAESFTGARHTFLQHSGYGSEVSAPAF